MPKVAILMAAFNGEKWIGKQLESILSQKDVIVDIFVSLDISSDKTLDILKSFKSNNNNNLFILPYGERFGCAAKNFFRLIKEINVKDYDFVAFSDQDDLWLPRKLSKGIELIKSSKSDAYSSDVMAFWQNGKKKLIKKSYPQKEYDFMFESAGPGFTYIFSIKPFIDFQEFVKNNWNEIYELEHDWLAYSFFRSKGNKWLIDNNSNVLYRQHENNQYGANVSILTFIHRLKLITSGWYAYQVKSISNILELPQVTIKFILINFMQTRRKKIHAISMLVFCLFFKK
mgnify:CR=1 FL=1